MNCQGYEIVWNYKIAEIVPQAIGADTLARKLSRCKEGMARDFTVMVQILFRVGAIAVNAL
jgi:hypothetical protein